MLASMRAELLVLRKWPAAWGLLLVTPVLVLLSDYVAEFISYLNLTPAEYAAYGTPAQAFASLTPSQFHPALEVRHPLPGQLEAGLRERFGVLLQRLQEHHQVPRALVQDAVASVGEPDPEFAQLAVDLRGDRERRRRRGRRFRG